MPIDIVIVTRCHDRNLVLLPWMIPLAITPGADKSAAEVSDFFRPFVDKEHENDDIRVVDEDGGRHVLEESRLAGLGGTDDQGSLPPPDGAEQVNKSTRGRTPWIFEGQAWLGVDRGQILEPDTVFECFRIHAFDFEDGLDDGTGLARSVRSSSTASAPARLVLPHLDRDLKAMAQIIFLPQCHGHEGVIGSFNKRGIGRELTDAAFGALRPLEDAGQGRGRHENFRIMDARHPDIEPLCDRLPRTRSPSVVSADARLEHKYGSKSNLSFEYSVPRISLSYSLGHSGMKIIKGIKVAPGIAIGRAFVIDEVALPRVRRRHIDPEMVSTELVRFETAREAAIDELNRVHAHAQQEMGEDTARVFLFHIGMLNDPAMLRPIRNKIEQDYLSPEYASAEVIKSWIHRFQQMDEPAFSTKINDLVDLANRLIGALIGRRLVEFDQQPDGETIVVARELTPSQTIAFDRTRILGIATEMGGPTSHTAIIARALGLPGIVGAGELCATVANGDLMIVDGDRGRIIVDPDEETIELYRGQIQQAKEYDRSLVELAGLPSVTTDGVEIELLGNIEFPDEAASVLERGGTGVGLYRTEFLYLGTDHEPTEEEHFEAYCRCIEHLNGAPLTIRTFDLGADKYTQSLSEKPERNPFLGQRSIRHSLAHLPMFRTQLRAILRASALGPVKVMLPLVTSVHEFRHSRYLIRDAMEDLDDLGIAYDPHIKVGIMVEVPAAVLLADAFAREVDFFSIGTNDLVQYTLAVDRTNERVASLYQPSHPAVLKLVRMVVRAARSKRIPVSCCGEAAGDLEYVPLLLGLGLRTLSMSPSGIPLVKRMVRSVSIHQCERLAKKAIQFDSELEAGAFLRDRVRKIVPEAFEGRSGED